MRRRFQQVVDLLARHPGGLTAAQVGEHLGGMSAANAASYLSMTAREAPIEYTVVWHDSPHPEGPARIRSYVWRLRLDLEATRGAA